MDHLLRNRDRFGVGRGVDTISKYLLREAKKQHPKGGGEEGM